MLCLPYFFLSTSASELSWKSFVKDSLVCHLLHMLYISDDCSPSRTSGTAKKFIHFPIWSALEIPCHHEFSNEI